MRFFLILLLACLSAGAQEAPPDLLVVAGQCLGTAKQDWLDLPHRKAGTVELGFLERDETAQVGPADSDTRPAGAGEHRGEQTLYVVDYSGPYHSEGTVFSFLAGGDKHHRFLQLLFTTRFRQVFFPDDGSKHAELVEPPVGGIGTHDEIISAIRQSGFEKTFKIPVTQLQKPPASVNCEMENELP